MFIVHTMEEIQGLLDAHEQFKATLGEADKEYQAIVTLVQQVESIAREHQVPGGLDNPYTSLTAKVDTLDARVNSCVHWDLEVFNRLINSIFPFFFKKNVPP